MVRIWEVAGGQRVLQVEGMEQAKVWKGERAQWVCKMVFWPRGLCRVTGRKGRPLPACERS